MRSLLCFLLFLGFAFGDEDKDKGGPVECDLSLVERYDRKFGTDAPEPKAAGSKRRRRRRRQADDDVRPSDVEDDPAEILLKDHCEDAADLCMNGGRCESTMGGPICVCSGSFVGPRCEAKDDPDKCLGHRCQNGATCYAPAGADQLGLDWLPPATSPGEERKIETRTYLCQCGEGFAGDLCERDNRQYECAENFCLGRGEGLYDHATQTCSCNCAPNFAGDHCQATTACADSRCRYVVTSEEFPNGCEPVDGSTTEYKCHCAKFFTGKNCEKLDMELMGGCDPCHLSRTRGAPKNMCSLCRAHFEEVFKNYEELHLPSPDALTWPDAKAFLREPGPASEGSDGGCPGWKGWLKYDSDADFQCEGFGEKTSGGSIFDPLSPSDKQSWCRIMSYIQPCSWSGTQRTRAFEAQLEGEEPYPPSKCFIDADDSEPQQPKDAHGQPAPPTDCQYQFVFGHVHEGTDERVALYPGEWSEAEKKRSQRTVTEPRTKEETADGEAKMMKQLYVATVVARCPCCPRRMGPTCKYAVNRPCCVDDNNKPIKDCFGDAKNKDMSDDPCVAALAESGSSGTLGRAGHGQDQKRGKFQTMGDLELCGKHGICIPDDTFDEQYRCMCFRDTRRNLSYTGDKCEAVDPCPEYGNPCGDVRNCLPMPRSAGAAYDLGHICLCPKGTSGAHCVPLDESPCAALVSYHQKDSFLNHRGKRQKCRRHKSGYLHPACRPRKVITPPCGEFGTCLPCGYLQARGEQMLETLEQLCPNVALDGKRFRCICEAGFKGLKCSEKAGICDTHPCHHGGTCHAPAQAPKAGPSQTSADVAVAAFNFTCECLPGYSGRTCEETDNACVMKGRWECWGGLPRCVLDASRPAGFRCNCSGTLREGAHCEIDPPRPLFGLSERTQLVLFGSVVTVLVSMLFCVVMGVQNVQINNKFAEAKDKRDGADEPLLSQKDGQDQTKEATAEEPKA